MPHTQCVRETYIFFFCESSNLFLTSWRFRRGEKDQCEKNVEERGRWEEKQGNLFSVSWRTRIVNLGEVGGLRLPFWSKDDGGIIDHFVQLTLALENHCLPAIMHVFFKFFSFWNLGARKYFGVNLDRMGSLNRKTLNI